jgi:hypothetical protein
METRIIGVVGFIGSGKGTVGDYLVNAHGFTSASFAHSLKDAAAAIFGWPRDLLEGNTLESRGWREVPCPYWSSKMGKPITPRWVLQYLGTDVMRDHFIDNIWIWSLEKKLSEHHGPTVITDVRFPNEIEVIKNLGGKLIWVRRHPEPEWAAMAMADPDRMSLRSDVHPSEYKWLNAADYTVVWNDGTLKDLQDRIDDLL